MGRVKVGLSLSERADRFVELVAVLSGRRKSEVVEAAVEALARCPPSELEQAVLRARAVSSAEQPEAR